MPSSSLYIPQELTDHIISLIDCYSTQTLKTCALVHSNWRRASQARLYHRTTIYPPHDSVDYQETRGILEFSSFLDSSPHLKSLIQTLHIDMSPTPSREPPVYDLDVLCAMLHRLPALKTLIIWDGQFAGPVSPAVAEVAFLGPQRLELRDYMPEEVDDFFRLLHVLPRVEALDFRSDCDSVTQVLYDVVRHHSEYDFSEFDFPVHLALNSVRLSDVDPGVQTFLLEFFRRTITVNTLSSISTRYCTQQEEHSLFALIQSTGNNLLDLSINLRRRIRAGM